MVTEKRDKNGNFERHLIFRDFMKSKTGEVIWKKNRSFLPVNVSQPYYIVIEATAGLKKKDSISVTNITLSKECFAISKFHFHPQILLPVNSFIHHSFNQSLICSIETN